MCDFFFCVCVCATEITPEYFNYLFAFQMRFSFAFPIFLPFQH